VSGTRTRAGRRRGTGTSRCCSGRARTAARGTGIHARRRRGEGISRCSSGRARMARRGANTRARSRRRAATSRCCSGRARTAALGMRRLVVRRRGEDSTSRRLTRCKRTVHHKKFSRHVLLSPVDHMRIVEKERETRHIRVVRVHGTSAFVSRKAGNREKQNPILKSRLREHPQRRRPNADRHDSRRV